MAGAVYACPLEGPTTPATVRAVVDGDTLDLTDGTRLRVLGYDAPELGRDGRADEPFARAARNRAAQLAPPGTRLALRRDVETRDRYGRSLAHAYLPDGRHLAATLLREGFGEILVLPPNVALADCLAAAEARARAGGRGVWTLPSHRVREAASLTPTPGYGVVRGTVSAVQASRRGTRVTLDERVDLWLPAEHRALFDPPIRADRLGRRLTARGILRLRSGRANLVVRHPSALEWAP